MIKIWLVGREDYRLNRFGRLQDSMESMVVTDY